jgi:putative membrane protein
MVAEHSKTTEELKPIAAKAKINLPTTMDSEHQEKIEKLKSLAADNLDKAHDAMQVETYQNAVSLFEEYAKEGDNPDLKQFAVKTPPHLQEHLKMARALK